MVSTMKRTLACAMGALALVLAFSLLGFTQQAQAAEYAAGSVKAQSTVAPAKKTVKGTLKSGTKVTKTFVMPEGGYVTFNVKLPKGLGSTALRIDHKSLRLVSTNVANGSLGNGKYTSSRFSVRPGTKFKVTLELPDSIIRQSLPYTITMTNKVPAAYEKERNDSKAKANALTLGKTCSGNIMKKGTDWFVFEAPKDGTYKVLGKMALFTDGSIARANMVLYKDSLSFLPRIISSGDGNTNLGTVTLKKGEKMYVKVTSSILSGNASDSYAVAVRKA